MFSGKKLAHYRRLSGFSQQQLADRVGLFQQDINILENSMRQPGAVLLFKLCQVLDIDNPFELNEASVGTKRTA